MQPKRSSSPASGRPAPRRASEESGTFLRASAPPELAPPLCGAFQSGAVVAGKYRVEQKIAEGGIGVVVLASHLELNRRVAIKYLQTKMLDSPSTVERFRREAQLAASLRSEHVVRVFDVGVLDPGGPYMVMEHLDGEDLGSVLARGPLPRQLAIDYVLQACDAIAEAHALDIVHRDLKPENLFLARRRRGGGTIVKLLDFGISKASTRSLERQPSVTEDGEHVGTPVYMSPEQLLSSGDVDLRSDIWALGVVLFELLTGTLPFAGKTMPQLCANILASPPIPLRARCPEASPELESILRKCLCKDPSRRYRNVEELAQELVPFGLATSHQLLESIKLAVRFGASVRPPSRSGGTYGTGTSDRPGVQASGGPVPELPAFVALKVDLNPSKPPAAPRARRSRLIAAVFVSVLALSLVGLWGAHELQSRSSARPTEQVGERR
jgi:serine/threonine-protein kinase